VRVVFACPFVPWPLETGGNIRTYHLIRHAAEHVDLELRLVRLPQPDAAAEDAVRALGVPVEFCERGPVGLGTRLARPKIERWFHSPRLAASLARDAADGTVDLLHLDELLLARAAPHPCPVPIAQHHHKIDTVLADRVGAAGLAARFDRFKLGGLERAAAARTRHHITCSEGDAEFLRARYPALETYAVPSGFDEDTFRPSTPRPEREADRLVFLGSMSYAPNVDGVRWFAREILPALAERRPEVKLTIVGRDPAPEVRALAGERIEVTGAVDDVRPYLERASLFLVPLRIGGGTRLKIVESLALETPTVSTTIGAEGLGLANGEQLALADRPEEWIATCSELLEDRERARALGRAGAAFVREHYRWPTLAARLADAWKQIAERS